MGAEAVDLFDPPAGEIEAEVAAVYRFILSMKQLLILMIVQSMKQPLMRLLVLQLLVQSMKQSKQTSVQRFHRSAWLGQLPEYKEFRLWLGSSSIKEQGFFFHPFLFSHRMERRGPSSHWKVLR
jgi:hypothetical protein